MTRSKTEWVGDSAEKVETGGSLNELTDQLEGLRRGVAETDEASRGKIGRL